MIGYKDLQDYMKIIFVNQLFNSYVDTRYGETMKDWLLGLNLSEEEFVDVLHWWRTCSNHEHDPGVEADLEFMRNIPKKLKKLFLDPLETPSLHPKNK